MRKKLLAFVFPAALLVAMTVPLLGGVNVASAKVHGVSQAGCANNPALSGANQSGSNSPAGPIPVTASAIGEIASGGAAAPESGGDGDPACDVR